MKTGKGHISSQVKTENMLLYVENNEIKQSREDLSYSVVNIILKEQGSKRVTIYNLEDFDLIFMMKTSTFILK